MSSTSDHSLGKIRGFLLDMDGTFYVGERLVEGALDFIEVLRQQRIEFLFLTNNSSKDARQYVDKLARLGLPVPVGKVLTSGDAAANYLRGVRPSARVYVVGTLALETEFQARGFTLTRDEPDVVVLGFDTTLTYDKLWRLCDLVRAGVTYVATHTDFNCPTETGFMPDIGATIAYVRAATGREPDVSTGKPNRLIAEQAALRLGLPLSDLCMVGDRLYTDIALGPQAGIPTVLVLSGETRPEALATSAHQPTHVFANLGGLAEVLQRG